MKNMDDYRFQNELEYQLALLESIRKLLLVYEKFYQEETKAICFRELAEVSCLIRS